MNKINDIDVTSISGIITSICKNVLEKHLYEKLAEDDIVTLSSSLIKLTVTDFTIPLISNDYEKTKEYLIFNNEKHSDIELLNKLKEMEPYLDKNKYIINAAKILYNLINNSLGNGFDNIDFKNIKKTLEPLFHRFKLNSDDEEKVTSFELLEYYLKIGKNIKMIIPDYDVYFEYNEVSFSDSREIFGNVNINKDKNKKYFEKINQILIDLKIKNGLQDLFKSMKCTDIAKLFYEEEIGLHILRCVNFLDYYNNVIGEEHKSSKRFDINDLDAFLKIDDYIKDETLVILLITQIVGFSYYINCEKFFSAVIDFIEDMLEKEEIDSKDAKMVLKEIQSLINKKNKFKNKPNIKILNRFLDDDYLPKGDINNIKEMLLNGTINVDYIDSKIFKLLNLTDNEIESILDNNINNFIWGTRKLGYTKEKTIERYNKNEVFSLEDVVIELYRLNYIDVEYVFQLYENKKISDDIFTKYYSEFDFLKNVSLEKIGDDYLDYKNSFRKDSHKKHVLDISIKLYKNLYVNEDTNQDEVSNHLIHYIYDKIDDENDLLFFYEKGLISLNAIADWCGEPIIKDLYDKLIIKLEDLESLYLNKKISKDFIQNIILNLNLSDDELLEYMYKGYFYDSMIIKIFETRNIYIKEALKLRKANLISKNTYFIIKNRDIKKIEDRIGRNLHGLTQMSEISMPKCQGRAISLPEIDKKSELKSTKATNSDNWIILKEKKLINPFIRLEFLKILKCRAPEKVFYDDDKNPFYHYNFYVIQDDYLGSDIINDAIIIAERIFNNRDKEDDFALENATYIMRYEDYLTLQGKQKEMQLFRKKGVIKEVPGAIYSVNHRSGSWAMNVLKAIAKAKAGNSFDDLTPNNRREAILDWLHTMYTDDELSLITDLIEEIDDEEMHTYSADEDGVYRRIYQDESLQYTKKDIKKQ